MKIQILIKKNAVFIGLTISMVVATLVIARYSTYPSLPGFHWLDGPAPQERIPYDLAMGYVVSYIFFVLQVQIPQKLKERNAKKVLMPLLKEYAKNIRILVTLLKKNEIIKLSKNEDLLKIYEYVDQNGRKTYEDFSIPIDLNRLNGEKPFYSDGRLYSFLRKTQHIYNSIVQSYSYIYLNEYIISLIQQTDIDWWVKTEISIMSMLKLGQSEKIEIENEEKYRNELEDALIILEKYIRVNAKVKECK